ncbi:MAG TPA: hypothetical protein VFX30_07605 [bacterium]|nr:hypothetical protein [bacterium]
MAILNINPLLTSTLMHQALNPVSLETSISYPILAETCFTALGDGESASFARRLRVENRIGVAFNVLFDATLFGFVDDLQNAWIDRSRTQSETPSHMPEDYDRAASAFRLAVSDGRELDRIDESLAAALDLAQTFSGSVGSLSNFQDWTARALELFLPEDRPAVTRTQTCLTLLGARLLWNRGIFYGASRSLGVAAEALRGEETESQPPEAAREEGFVRYARALVLLLNKVPDFERLHGALGELEESIACFRRSREAFPYILHKRLSEAHKILGRAHHDEGDLRTAAYHFGQAREIGKRKLEPGIPEARALPRGSNKGWKAALRSIFGKG